MTAFLANAALPTLSDHGKILRNYGLGPDLQHLFG